jgi:hypothetical protein
MAIMYSASHRPCWICSGVTWLSHAVTEPLHPPPPLVVVVVVDMTPPPPQEALYLLMSLHVVLPLVVVLLPPPVVEGRQVPGPSAVAHWPVGSLVVVGLLLA